MSKHITRMLLLAATLSMACDAPTPPSTPDAAEPPPVVALTSQPDGTGDARVFLDGTHAQQQLVVAMRTATLRNDADTANSAEMIKVLTELFYSEPTSMLQLSAGLELARLLSEIEEREAALNVLSELDAVELEPDYMPALNLKIARQYHAMHEPTQARAAYLRVLADRPDYMFVWQEIAQMSSDDEAPQRYESWRDEQLEALHASDDASSQLAILELLSMVQGDDAHIDAAFTTLAARSNDDRVRAVIAQWQGAERGAAQESVTTQEAAHESP